MSKRTATTSAPKPSTSKKAKRAPSPSPEFESAGEGSSDFGSFEDLDDSEEDEFAQLPQGKDEDEEIDSEGEMIGDDGEDLMAGLDDEDLGEDALSLDDGDDLDGSDDQDAASDAAQVAPAPLKKSNVRNSRAPKPLTASEIRALAFAELTASPISSTIATNVTTYLEPLTPPAPSTSPLQPLLKALHAHIVQLPSRKPVTLDALRKKGLVVPPVEGAKGKWAQVEYGWEKPRSEQVRVVGKWAWGGGIKVGGEYTVELAVAMPQTLVRPKDHLSPRFLISSTHYLVQLASQLPTALLGPVSLSYVSLPSAQGYALEVRSAHVKGSSGDKVGLSKIKGAVLRIRIVWPTDAIPLKKLAPLSNQVRPDTSGENLQLKPSELPSTPLHSTSLLLSSLAVRTAHLASLHATASSHPSFSASARLLQTWASRRGFGQSMGLTDDWWAWCVSRTLGWGASMEAASGAAGGDAWAGWRKAVEWLAGANWVDGIWFRTEGDKAFDREEMRAAYKGEPLFVDPTGTVNLAAGIPLATLEMLKQDAKTTISLLLTSATDEVKFEAAFTRALNEGERFDNFATVTVPKEVLKAARRDKDAALDYDKSIDFLHASISSTLRRAFGTRAKAFQLIAPAHPSIPLTGPAAPAPSTAVFTLGILADGSESVRLVDHGPSAEDAEACADFSAFWGSKSELRRFKDGTIMESIVWDAPSAGALGQRRHTILAQIVKHILRHRHAIPEGNVDIFAGAMDHLIVEPEAVRRAIFLEDSVATNKNFGNLLAAYDILAKELKDLPELPLAISAVAPSTPGLRYSSVFIPSPRRLNTFGSSPASTKFIEAHEIIITLEGSGRWPDDLEGVQKIKAAFLVKIAEQLNALHSIESAQIVFDLEARPTDDNVSLEILTHTGYAFRARIFYDRTQVLLEQRAAKMGGVAPSAGTTSSEELHTRRFVAGPKHHLGIHTLQHHFPSYSHTVRLTKRWFSAQLLSPYFPEELLELVVASVFLDSATPYEAPQSGATGFARVMDRLGRWNWREEALQVPLYSFSASKTSGRRANFPKADEAKEAFNSRRAADPAVNEFAWLVQTEDDLEGTVWGRTDKVVCGRARGLARATIKALNEAVREGGLTVESLFSPPMEDYNFLIHLDPSLVPRHFQSVAPQPRALSARKPALSAGSSIVASSFFAEEDDTPHLGLDPIAQLIASLNKLYSNVFMLFYDPDGGSAIAGIWHPAALGQKSWKVGLGFPVDTVGEKKVELDQKAVLREVERLGKGLVVRTEVL